MHFFFGGQLSSIAKWINVRGQPHRSIFYVHNGSGTIYRGYGGVTPPHPPTKEMATRKDGEKAFDDVLKRDDTYKNEYSIDGHSEGTEAAWLVLPSTETGEDRGVAFAGSMNNHWPPSAYSAGQTLHHIFVHVFSGSVQLNCRDINSTEMYTRIGEKSAVAIVGKGDIQIDNGTSEIVFAACFTPVQIPK